MRIGFLGPEGTFTHETADLAVARRRWMDAQFVPYPSGVEAVRALARSDVDVAVVAVATSLGGPITPECEAIAEARVREVERIQRVCHYHLLALPGATLAGVTAILSHPKALDDCRAHLAVLTPGVPRRHTPSTAAAAERVAADGRPGQAAVGTATAARRYGLAALAENIEDDAENWTRWVILTRP